MAVLISFGTLGSRLRYAQVEVDICAFRSDFSQQLPLICARLKVGHSFSTIAFDRRLVVSLLAEELAHARLPPAALVQGDASVLGAATREASALPPQHVDELLL